MGVSPLFAISIIGSPIIAIVFLVNLLIIAKKLKDGKKEFIINILIGAFSTVFLVFGILMFNFSR